ncbi:uncharacterized protein LOC111077614 [Drosophila obscura]|uniref:uncharacterized protein LOC111077614 n=1 Tax=Drosophila obscura TaxID=7282 RepID=UPI001BB1E40F|nr:uncharacterized protein LOC111077614 [Drosophila obscura]
MQRRHHQGELHSDQRVVCAQGRPLRAEGAGRHQLPQHWRIPDRHLQGSHSPALLWRYDNDLALLQLTLFWVDWLTAGSQQLQQANVNIIDGQQCAGDRSIFGKFSLIQGISERTLCTLGSGRTGACCFDEGAPLLVNGSLVGILGRVGCAGKPDVYANLARHRRRLKENTK